MPYVLSYFKKMYAFAGISLIFNVAGMALISLFEGIGIYMLVPMLSVIGLITFSSIEIPFSATFMNLMNGVPASYKLPAVLVVFAIIIIGQALLQRQQAVFNMSIQQRLTGHLRTEMYQALLRADWSFFLRKRKSDFNHIMTQELARVSNGINLLLSLTTSLIFTVIQIGFTYVLSPRLTIAVLICGFAFGLFARKFIKGAKSLGARTSELAQSYMAGITESFNGIKDIKSNRLEEQHLTWFQGLNMRMEQNMIHFAKLSSTSQLMNRTISALCIAGFVYLSYYVFQVKGEQMIVIVLIFSRLWPRFSIIQSSWEQIVSTIPAFKGLAELERECAMAKEQPEDAKRIEPLRIQSGIACKDVSFRYNAEGTGHALERINLHIPARSMTAIVGKSGAGKSTLIDVLIGLIRPSEGDVLIDGIPLSGDRIHALRQTVSYVSQDPFLFNASIRENLLLVERDATELQMWEALQFSALDDFVRRLPQGLDTMIGDRGVRLSGGERQRLVLARAILRNPDILVLDEATSALDSENEAKIQAALEKLRGRMTIIVIAHRLSTIRHADQVIVLEQGRVVQQGGYQQLAKETKGTFGRLLAVQAEGP